jgi:hypothetical protein
MFRGRKTDRAALAMVAEVVYGAPYRFTDQHASRSPTAARQNDPDPEIGGSASKIGANRRARRAQKAGPLGSTTRAPCHRPHNAGTGRPRAAALFILWRPQRLWVGAQPAFGENRAGRRSMSRTPRRYDAEQVRRFSDTTIGYYDQFAWKFWNGTRDHDVSQNYTALLDASEGAPPYSIRRSRNQTG